MKIIIRILLSLVALLVLAIGGFYLYVETLPTAPPNIVAANDLVVEQDKVDFSCATNGEFNYAYQVKVAVETMVNDQMVYQSEIKFKTQLSQANGSVIKGAATNITVDEGNGATAVQDLTYLTRVDTKQYAVFSAYNNLGLQRQHPMAIISQFLKALSVGEPDEAYFFAYDPMQRTYRYQHDGGKVERADYPSTFNIQQLANVFNDYKSNWQVVLSEQCVPKSLVSEEIQGIAAGQGQGYAKFRIEAELIPSYTNTDDYHYEDIANSANVWSVKLVNVSEFEKPVTSSEQMWEIINGFTQSKSVGKLIKAANYMIDNIAVDELSGVLAGTELSDEAKRELAFGLGISGNPEAERYIVSTVDALPKGLANGIDQQRVDLQKVRLITAAATNGDATSEIYSYLNGLLEDEQQSNNVHKNALLHMGTAVTQLNRNGGNDSQLESALRETIGQQLESKNAATAILSAGNAKLDGYSDTFKNFLNSSNDRERYAAATVLARDPQNYASLIESMAKEPSNFVVNAIATGMQAEQLSDEQRVRLKEIREQAEGDKVKIIDALLNKK